MRDFRTFYYSFSNSFYKKNEVDLDILKEAWQHWYHKVSDYLLLKKIYPNKVIIVKYEDLILKKIPYLKKLSNVLSLPYAEFFNSNTINGTKVLANTLIKNKNELLKKNNTFLDYQKLEYKFLKKKYFQLIKKINQVALK